MTRRGDISEHIAQVPMFAMCTKKELRTISRSMTERDVAAGKVLIREGRPGSDFIIVLDGEAVATRDGTELARFGPGDYFGEIAILDPGERTATVTAATAMSIGVASPSEFGQMLDEVPTLAHKIMRGLARQLRELTTDPSL
jgi:CRP/FNR family transcriptional regulator, cyclic AMP receptor protein